MKLLLTFILTLLLLNNSYSQATSNFTATPLNICLGEEIQFTDLSTSPGTIISWSWDFGDGSSASVKNPTHTYTNAGNFTVTLTVVDGNGAVPEVKVNFITVKPLPNPSFTPSVVGGCSLPSEVALSNIQPNSGVTYSWSFGNGTNSTSATPGNVTYTTPGTYDITLSVTDNITSCENTITESIDIFDYQADFSFSPSAACVASTVSFTDESSSGTDRWSWNFGDGTTSSNANPTHSFSTVGTYTVTLSATNSANGCNDSFSETIEVFALPNPSFSFDENSGCAPLDVNFTNTSSGGGTFEWDFGDGNTALGQNPPAHSYTSNGVYSVTLTQTDANGCSNSVFRAGIITVSSIVADFEADKLDGCETLEVTFSDLSNSPNTTDPIIGWEWDFGNGSVFSGNNPPVQSYTEGIYDVELTVSTNAGCSQTITYNEYISVGVIPNADFSWNPPSDCAKSDFEFTNLTTISVPHIPSELVYEWDFGDGGDSNDENPFYEYPQDTGYFDVQLIVNFRGCPDTVIYTDAVYIDAPIALFNVAPSFCNPTLPLDVTFNDQAIIGKVTDNAEMIWTWGDGSSSVITPPDLYNDNPGPVIHTYNSLGSYTIKQVVHNYTTGCSDSITNIINISEIEANIGASNDSVCVNNSVYFNANGSHSNYPLIDFVYDLDDDTLINGQNIHYNYDTPGTYDITLTVSNNVGCQDSKTFTGLRALALPTSAISPSATVGCSPLEVTFTNNSTSQSGVPLASFNWTFENGTTQTTTSVGQTTNYTFTNEGVFQTRLSATDEFGCVSSTRAVQTEITKPTALFTLPALVCNDEEFTATNNSIDYNVSEWFINDISESMDNSLTTSLNHIGSSTVLSFSDSLTLIVTDANGCKDTLKQEIIVSTPHADYDFTFSGANINDDGNYICPPVFATMSDLSNSYGTITNWNWDFGDGKTSTLQNPNNTYVFAGTYSGTLIITDEFGCTDSIVYEDYLTIGGPSGALAWTLNNLCGQEYTFTPTDLEGVIDVLWAMGNGDTISSLETFNYAYSQAGTYTPTAILINANDCNVSYILDPITVIVTPLNPYFEINPSSMNWGEPATISDFSSGGYGGIIDWHWDTEIDQFNNSGGTFDHLINSSGNVVITLVVTDTAGCKNAYQTEVNVTRKITIPNVLTPNGDGDNDVFVLIDNVYKSYTVVILNRWGNVVSETYVEEDNYLWNGLNKNDEPCTDGVYFYKIDGIQRDGEARTEHGFVHLMR